MVELKVGDVVRLRSGGLPMTVVSTADAAGIETAWFDEVGAADGGVFPQGALRKQRLFGALWIPDADG